METTQDPEDTLKVLPFQEYAVQATEAQPKIIDGLIMNTVNSTDAGDIPMDSDTSSASGEPLSDSPSYSSSTLEELAVSDSSHEEPTIHGCSVEPLEVAAAVSNDKSLGEVKSNNEKNDDSEASSETQLGESTCKRGF